MDWLPLNFQLLASPMNWIIIMLMLLIAVYAFHLVFPNPPANQQ